MILRTDVPNANVAKQKRLEREEKPPGNKRCLLCKRCDFLGYQWPVVDAEVVERGGKEGSRLNSFDGAGLMVLYAGR